MKVRELMRSEVVSVTSEASLRDVARLLAERGISGVPVVDADGMVLGVVSESDIVAKETGHQQRRGGLLARLASPAPTWDELRVDARTARDAMTYPVVTIEADRPVAAAAALLTRYGINRLPVVADGRLIGIVTRSDLVRAFARPDDEIAREIREDVIVRQLWLPPGSVSATVTDGDVVLEGEVESAASAEVLPRLVERVPGVVSVTSRVAVTVVA